MAAPNPYSGAVGHKQPVGLSEEAIRLKQIQDIATFMKIQIPKRFMFDQSKQAIREFIQSRAFIIQMKQTINQQLYDTMNKSNGMMDAIRRRHESWQNYQGLIQQRMELKRKEKNQSIESSAFKFGDPSKLEFQSPQKKPKKTVGPNSPSRSREEVFSVYGTSKKEAKGSPK